MTGNLETAAISRGREIYAHRLTDSPTHQRSGEEDSRQSQSLLALSPVGIQTSGMNVQFMSFIFN